MDNEISIAYTYDLLEKLLPSFRIEDACINKIIINQAIDTLNDIEKEIIELRILKDYSQEEVSDFLRLNQALISRLEKRALKKLRNYIDIID